MQMQIEKSKDKKQVFIIRGIFLFKIAQACKVWYYFLLKFCKDGLFKTSMMLY